MLPIRTTLDDIDAVCSYLVTKPTGATLAEMKAIVDRKYFDGRKLNALKFWGVIEDDTNGKTKITDRGRLAVRDSGSSRSQALGEVIRQVKPYSAQVERVVHSRQETMAATDVAAHWHEHFRDDVAGSDKILNDQAVSFRLHRVLTLEYLPLGAREGRLDLTSILTRRAYSSTVLPQTWKRKCL